MTGRQITDQHSIRADYLSALTTLLRPAGCPVLAITFALCFPFAYSACAQSLAQPTQRVIPANIDATTGNITVGTTVYAGANPGMNIVALNRASDPNTPGVISAISNQTFTSALSANQFLQKILSSSNNPDAIIILNAVGNYGFALEAIANSLHQFGANHEIDQVSTALPFTFIGNGGLNIGSAHQCGGICDMTGYFATDSNGKYTLIQPDYVTYHITTDGTIQIGSTKYPVAGSTGCTQGSGFHIVVVPRDLPEGQPLFNNTYCTNSGNASLNAESFQHFAGDLVGQGASWGGNTDDLTQDESRLVFVASSGNPIPSDWSFGTDGDARVYPVAHNIAQLGGYFETMVYLTPSDTYSLVGAAAPPSSVKGGRMRAKEASSVYPDHPTGELHGALARGLRGNWYSPVSGALTAQENLGFYEILAQQPIPFPVPDTADQVTQFNYIGTQLLYTGNLRNGYTDTDIVSANWYSTLLNMNDPTTKSPCPNPLPPSPTAFCAVRAQLLTEFFYVGDIQAFAKNLANLVQNSAGTETILDLLNADSNIQANLPAPSSAPTPNLAGPIVNLILGVGSLIPEVGSIFGLADTLFNFGTSLTTDTSGNQTINLNSTVASLAGDAANHFKAELTIIGTQFDFIYQDWGKINALGAALASGQTAWAWNGSSTAGQIVSAMDPAIKQSFYQSLMAALYAVGSYVPGCNYCGAPGPPAWGQTPLWAEPQAYTVLDPQYPCSGCADKSQPFNYPWYIPFTFPSDPDTTNPVTGIDEPSQTLLADGGWLGISTQTTQADSGSTAIYNPPATSILTTLFTPLSQSGLGVYRPALFESWPFPRVTCGWSDDGSGDPGPGCSWGSAAPAPETLTAPFTSVSIEAGRIFRNGTRLNVQLGIHNSGTTDFTSLEISHIAVRTLAGPGEATLLGPALPIHIGKRKPGKLDIITLSLEVPHSVKKLELTENGTIDSGESSPYKFGLGQVIFPKNEK